MALIVLAIRFFSLELAFKLLCGKHKNITDEKKLIKLQNGIDEENCRLQSH